MAQKSRINLGLQVVIRPETFDRLSQNMQGVAPSDALSGMCSTFLENTADGGLALTPDQVTKIQQNYGKVIASSKDVVRATESQKNLSEGKSTFTFSVDPSFLPPLEQRAKEVGRPIGELMSDVVDWALFNNWIYDVTYEGKRRTFSPAVEDALAKKIGVPNFTIADLVNYIADLERAVRKAEREAVAV